MNFFYQLCSCSVPTWWRQLGQLHSFQPLIVLMTDKQLVLRGGIEWIEWNECSGHKLTSHSFLTYCKTQVVDLQTLKQVMIYEQYYRQKNKVERWRWRKNCKNLKMSTLPFQLWTVLEGRRNYLCIFQRLSKKHLRLRPSITIHHLCHAALFLLLCSFAISMYLWTVTVKIHLWALTSLACSSS